MQRTEEVAADGALETLAKPVRHEKDSKTDQRDENEQGLKGEIFAAAKNEGEFGEKAHADEIGAGKCGGERAVEKSVGGIDIDLGKTAAGE